MGLTKQQIDFVNTIGSLASADMRQSGVLASLTIAQAILESAYGTSSLAVRGKALFGVKAGPGWNGKVFFKDTQECYDGVHMQTITEAFRAYNSWEESIQDHSRFLQSNNRYSKIIGEQNYQFACRAIQSAGYATDPNYASRLIQLIEQLQLYNFDMGDKKMDNTPDTWAQEAVNWAVQNKILNGDENGDLKLRDNCTREQVVVFLYRLYKYLNDVL